SSAPPIHRIVATYFHNTTRCATCLNIEQLARATMEIRFAAEMAAGKLVWRSLNMEERENEHYAIDYSLTSPSLVLAEMDGDREVRFKVLTETWTLIHKKLQFEPYIENETHAFLEGL
ncbi:MAG: nitrophenyl compound nitroreductase subunit ArsF family protein, partial [Candidatus Bipolaricaulota bacterium]|nr:nitrophenyl compound nitroreductase subunit ArsF family protein [Candidatus Bipolaricaulota bacterium]